MPGASEQPTGDRVTLWDFEVLAQFPDTLQGQSMFTEYAANQSDGLFSFLVLHVPYSFYTVPVLL